MTQPNAIPRKTQFIFKCLFVLSLFAIVYLATNHSVSTIDIQYADKFKHTIAFFWLTLLSFLGWRNHWLVRFLFIIAFGALIEIVQHYLPYRSASIPDLLADTFGILLFEILRLWFRPKPSI